jgi:hypothetical protein
MTKQEAFDQVLAKVMGTETPAGTKSSKKA